MAPSGTEPVTRTMLVPWSRSMLSVLADPAAPVVAVLTSVMTPFAGTSESFAGAPAAAPGRLSTIDVPES